MRREREQFEHWNCIPRWHWLFVPMAQKNIQKTTIKLGINVSETPKANLPKEYLINFFLVDKKNLKISCYSL